jgi:hypothetical protein
MATLDQSDLKLLSKAFSDALHSAGALGKSGFGAPSKPYIGDKARRSNRENDSAQDNVTDGLRKSFKALKQSTASLTKLAETYYKADVLSQEYQNAEKKFTEAIKDSTNYLDAYTTRVAKMASLDLPAQAWAIKRLVDSSSSFSSKLAKSQQAASLLSASLISNHKGLEEGTGEYGVFIERLSNAANGMSEQFLKQEQMWDDLAGGIRDNLGPEDFARLRTRLGEAGTTLTKNFEGLSGLGIKNIHDLASLGSTQGATFRGSAAAGHEDELGKVLLATVKELTVKGYSINGLKASNGIEISDTDIRHFVADTATAAAALSDFAKTAEVDTLRLDTAAKDAATVTGRLAMKLQGFSKDITGTFLRHLGSDAAAAKGAARLKDGLTQTYNELTSFNMAQVPASFGQVAEIAVRMGLSFEQATKFLQDNQHALALLGPQQFSVLRASLGESFQKFGYNLEQSSTLIGPALQMAIASGGVDLQDKNAVRGFVDTTLESFSRVSAATGATADEFFKVHTALLNSEGVSRTLLGLGKSQAAQYAKSITLATQEIAVRTGSLALAQQLVQEQESAKREDIDSRVTEAAQLSQLAQQLGYGSEDANRLYQTILAGNAASQQDQEWMRKILPEMSKRNAENANQYAGTGNISGQISTELLHKAFEPDGAFGKLLKGNEEVARLGQSNALLSQEQAAAAAKAAQGSKIGAETSSFINSIGAFFNNGFVKIITGTGLAITALGIQSIFAARSLGSMAGSGLLSNVKSLLGMGGAAATTGTTVAGSAAGGLAAGGGLLATLKGGVGSAAAGVANRGPGALKMGLGGALLGLGGDLATGAGYNNVGAVAGIGADALSGAALGGLLGPIGAVIGGLAGAGYGLYSHIGEFGNSNIPSPNSPLIAGQPDNGSQAGTVNNQSEQPAQASASGINNVSDPAAIQQLTMIAENTALSAKILQQIMDSGTRGTQLSPMAAGQRTTAYDYQTGRR